MSDSIRPEHYQGGIECIDAIEEALTPEEFAGFCKGNVFKYLWREKDKNGIEDLKKAKWYLDRLVASFDDLLAEASGANETPVAPTKRYREPTQEDLKNGPIECEYRDDCDEQWRSGLLVYVLDAEQPFLCLSKERDIANQWEQCQIEVAE